MKRSQCRIQIHRRLITGVIVSVATTFFAACGGDDSDGDPATSAPTEDAATSTPAAATQDPVGVIAIGHSGMNAQNSNPEMPGYGAPQNSWATGTSTEFESVYERLVAIQPRHEGHVFNAAEGGAESNLLAEQAEFALKAVPAPALVMIATIDNEIRCDGTDETRVKRFGENVKAALDVIVEASPRSRVLMVSFLGRPAQAASVIGADATLRAEVTGSGQCHWFNASGELVEANIAHESSIIEMYEAEQARVCEQVPQCHSDDGVFTTYQDDLSRIIPGDGHLNVAGQAAVAELIWPTVEALMTAD